MSVLYSGVPGIAQAWQHVATRERFLGLTFIVRETFPGAVSAETLRPYWPVSHFMFTIK